MKEAKVIYFKRLIERLREENGKCEYPEFSRSYVKNSSILERIIDWELMEN